MFVTCLCRYWVLSKWEQLNRLDIQDITYTTELFKCLICECGLFRPVCSPVHTLICFLRVSSHDLQPYMKALLQDIWNVLRCPCPGERRKRCRWVKCHDIVFLYVSCLFSLVLCCLFFLFFAFSVDWISPFLDFTCHLWREFCSLLL